MFQLPTRPADAFQAWMAPLQAGFQLEDDVVPPLPPFSQRLLVGAHV